MTSSSASVTNGIGSYYHMPHHGAFIYDSIVVAVFCCLCDVTQSEKNVTCVETALRSRCVCMLAMDVMRYYNVPLDIKWRHEAGSDIQRIINSSVVCEAVMEARKVCNV